MRQNLSFCFYLEKGKNDWWDFERDVPLWKVTCIPEYIYTSENVCMKCIQEKVPYKAYPCFKKINHTFVHKICQV